MRRGADHSTETECTHRSEVTNEKRTAISSAWTCVSGNAGVDSAAPAFRQAALKVVSLVAYRSEACTEGGS